MGAYHDEVTFISLLREEIVVNHYRSRGYAILSETDDQTREVFGIAAGTKAADVVVQISERRAIVAEVKGKNLDEALLQLEATVLALRPRFQHVACKVFTSIPVPAGDSVSIRGGNFSPLGYRAVRVFQRDFPGEWPLWKLTASGGTESFRIGDAPVCMIFGPFAPVSRR